MYKKISLEKGILLPYQTSSRRISADETGAKKLKKYSPIMKWNEKKLEKALLFLDSEFGDNKLKNNYKL